MLFYSVDSGMPVYGKDHAIPEFNIARTICFTGHREKFIGSESQPQLHQLKVNTVKIMMCRYIDEAVRHGFDTFITGLASGFDLWAADYVLKLKKKDPEIRIVGVMPFAGHGKFLSSFYRNILIETEKKTTALISVCDNVNMGRSGYAQVQKKLYFERNTYMVEHSSEVIAFCNGIKSGTKNTVDYANRIGHRVHSFSINDANRLIENNGGDVRLINQAAADIAGDSWDL